MCIDMNGNRLPRHRSRSLRKRPYGPFQFGIVSTPDKIADAYAGKSHGMIAKAQLPRTIQFRRCFIDSAAFFGFVGAAPVRSVEDNAIPRLNGRRIVGTGRRNRDTISRDRNDSPQTHATMARGTSGDNLLMIGAADKERAKTARIDLLQLQ